MIIRSPDEPAAIRPRPAAAPRPQGLAESFQGLWVRLNNVSESPLRSLGLTSSQSGEGVTTVACNLAMAAGGCGTRTLLVDANLRSPGLHRQLGVLRGPGLSDVVAGHGEWKEAILPTAEPGLSFLQAGLSTGEWTGGADWSACRELLQQMSEQFDLTIVDLPPVGTEGATLPLAAALEGVALVVEAEKVAWEAAHHSAQLLTQARARLLGVILNKKPNPAPGWFHRR